MPEDAFPLDPTAYHQVYGALKELTQWWANWMPDDAGYQGGRDALEAARAALKAAEGKK